MKKQFYFNVDLSCALSVDEIWPDGDAPENPTVEDVKERFYAEGDSGFDVARTLRDWCFLDDPNVVITEMKP